jgi:hypothetical protein
MWFFNTIFVCGYALDVVFNTIFACGYALDVGFHYMVFGCDALFQNPCFRAFGHVYAALFDRQLIPFLDKFLNKYDFLPFKTYSW